MELFSGFLRKKGKESGMDRGRLGRMVGECSNRAFCFAYRLCGNLDEAKDLVQEACVRVFSKWELYDPQFSFNSYFLTVLRNIYYDGLRRERLETVSLDGLVADAESPCAFVENLADGEEPLLDRLMKREAAQDIARGFKKISREHRAVLVLCAVEGLSYSRIAEVLGCPLGTVRSRVSRARNALKAALGSRAEEAYL